MYVLTAAGVPPPSLTPVLVTCEAPSAPRCSNTGTLITLLVVVNIETSECSRVVPQAAMGGALCACAESARLS